MKLWKSPVFYLGILLLLSVAGALAAPYVIDWGQYRTALEDYGRKLTGREVRAEGPIAVRLFPWPKLVIDDVKVANPPGAADPYLLTAERIDVSVTLAGLFNGEIQVESIDIVKPAVSLERMATGELTWDLQPSARVVKSRLLEHVKLDNVALKDATITLIDARRGSTAEIANVNAAVSAPSIEGPWKARGGGYYNGRPLELQLTTGVWQADQPVTLSARLTPGDQGGLIYEFDGNHDGRRISGELRVTQAAGHGKTDAEGAFRPLVLIAKVKAGFDAIDLSSIAIAPREDPRGASLLSGTARIALGSTIGLSADLTAAKFNLDAVAGAKAKALLREGSGLTLLAELLGALPEGIDGKGVFRINSLIAGGEKLQHVLLSASVTRDAIRISELSAGLPGQTQARFEGVFISGSGSPQLVGDVSAESLDLRALVAWAWPERKEALLKSWSGNRGRLKLQTRLDAAPERLRLSEATYQLDDARGTGSLTFASGPRPSIEARLDASLADIDSFIPNGIAAVSPQGGDSLAALLAILPDLGGPADLGLSLTASRLLLNGVEAKNAVIDVSSSPRGLELRRVEIGDVGGARFAVSGLVAKSAGQLNGSLSASVAAKDPRGLLKLAGFVSSGQQPKWFKPLGETDLTLAIGFKPGPGGKAASIDVAGRTGKLDLALTAALVDSLDWHTARIEASGEIKSGLSSPILDLAGLVPVVASEAPGSVSVTLLGSLKDGVKSDMQADLFGAKLRFQGQAGSAPAGFKLAGRAGLSAERPQAMLRALGLVIDDAPLFSAEGDLNAEDGKITLSGIRGLSGGEPFGGELAYAPGRRLTGSLDLPYVDLPRLLAQLYLPWNGKPADPEAPFAAALPLGLQGEIWIKPHVLRVIAGLDVTGSQIGITAEGREIRLALFGKTDRGDNLALDLNGKAVPGGRVFEGKLTLPIDLAGRLKTADGQAIAAGVLVLDGGFSGFGRSPASVLAGLNGSGSYKLRGVSVGQLEPSGFASRIAKAKSQEDVDAALSALVSGRALALADTIGTITVQDGMASFLPLKLKTDAAEAVIRPLAELATGRIDIGIAVQLTSPPGMPGMEIAYAGSPMTLSRSVDAQALQSKLGMDVLQRGVDELERLQKEQQRIAAIEEKARAEDAARLEAYEAKRRELRQRQREIRVHRRLQEQEAKRAKEEAKALKEAAREVEAEEPSVKVAPPPKPQAAPEPPPRRKPKPKVVRQAPKKAEPEFGPVVIVPPADPPPPPQKQKPKTLFDFLSDL